MSLHCADDKANVATSVGSRCLQIRKNGLSHFLKFLYPLHRAVDGCVPERLPCVLRLGVDLICKRHDTLCMRDETTSLIS